jgi:GAF domain-containing protein
MRKLFLLIAIIATLQPGAQQLNEKYFAHYTTDKGLTHNSITGLAQDATGYIWISTPLGLNRFNGSRFVQYHSTNHPMSLASEDLSGMAWLNQSELGICNTGLHIINTKTGAQRNVFVPYHRKQYQYKFNMMERAMGDSEGNLYLLTRSGFYHFDKRDSLLLRFDYYTEADVPVAHFFFGKELFRLDDHRLMLITIDGLFEYDTRARKLQKMTAQEWPLLAEFLGYPASYNWFLQPKPGTIIALKSLSDTLVYIDISANRKTITRLPIKWLKEELHWRSKLLRVNDSLFYITAHNSGFYQAKLNKATGIISLSEKYFSDYLCTALLLDKAGKLWVGTTKGLFRQDDGSANIVTTPLPPQLEKALPDLRMHRVFVNGDRVFAGTRSSGYLLVYDKKDLRILDSIGFEKYRGNELSGFTYNVYSITELDPNTLLLTTNGLPMLVNKRTRKASPLHLPLWMKTQDWAPDAFTDSKGITWISSRYVYQYSHKSGQAEVIPAEVQAESGLRLPEVMREDGEGNIWMAGHGVARYNTRLKKFDVRLDSFPYIKMPDKQVNVMAIDKKTNTVWFNSYNNGLISYSIKEKKMRLFTTADGLPDNNISALYTLDDKLWIASHSGLACMNLQSFEIRGFGKEDGFPNMPVVYRANFFYDSAAQQLYLPFARVLARFNPYRLWQKSVPPQVFVESITISNQQPVLLPATNVTTSWKNAEILLRIGAINFEDGGNQRYAYRILKNESTPWMELGSQPSFSISQLSPGTHRIQVKLYSAANRWPAQVREMILTVTPPFWQRAWFLVVAGVLLVATIYLIVRWRTRIVQRKEAIKTQIEKLKADDYKAQFELEQISNYFSSSLSGKKNEDEVLWDVAQNLIGHLNYEDCIIYVWNKDKTRMVQKAAYGPKGEPGIISADGFVVAPGQGIVGHVIETRQPVLVNDTRKDQRYRVDDQYRLSEVAVPILHNNELLGVIDSEHSAPNYYTERDIKILTTIATLIGNKLTQIKSEQKLEAKQKELAGINEQLAEAKLSALQAQMNPHFIFNALNSIKRMILDADNEKASRYLSKFALMIRMTLEHSRKTFVTLDENIEYLKAYLDMEKLRFDDTFTYCITTDDELDTSETVLPPMMIQPLVENAIWHGLMQAGKNKKIRIAFAQLQNKLACIVEDNGIGIQHAEKLKEKQRPLHRSVGLENLQKRIKIMNEKYATDCTMDIIDLHEAQGNGNGTRVVLKMNVITVAEAQST